MKNRLTNRYHGGFVRFGLLFALAWFAAGAFFLYRAYSEPDPVPQATSSRAPTIQLCSNQPVLDAKHRTRNIEDVQVGDYVLAKDPDVEGPPTPHKVLATPVNYTHHVVHIQVSQDGQVGGELQATREHPFYTSNRGWLNAMDLRAGDQLQDTQGQAVTVAGVQIEDRTCDTFNLTVDGLHTFYVLAGDTPVLVHNVHGNSLDSPRQTVLYKLYDQNDVYQKIGITSQMPIERRYGIQNLKDSGWEMRRVGSGTRRAMAEAEREIVKANPGPLNKEKWAGKKELCP